MELKEQSIIDMLNERVKTDPNGIAVEQKNILCADSKPEGYTWQELDEITDLLAFRMLGAGIPAGEHVGIWSFNSKDWVFTFFAVLKIGAIPILFNSYLSSSELKDSAGYADCKFIFVDETSTRREYLDVLNELKQELCVRNDWNAETSGRLPNPFLTLFPMGGCAKARRNTKDEGGAMASKDLREELERRKRNIGFGQPACMMFTSGTSSTPKGVVLSHYSLVNNASAIARSMHWSKRDRMCICVPMFHCFGLTAGILSCLVSGATMYILARFKTQDVWDSIVNGGCTILNGVPSMFLAMIRKEKYKDLRPRTLVSGIIAGSPISSKEYLEVCDRLKGVKLQPSYGQTETSPCVSIADWEESDVSKSHHCGRAIENVEVKISETDSFDICFQSDEDIEACRLLRCGEILVRGYNTMMGYYKRKKEDSFTEDGWLKTGDAGYLDEEGRLHITGRIKEMIIRAGENISPSEIEECIKQINGIKDVKVIGIKAEVVQEEILACIVLEKHARISDDTMYHILKKKLASYKIPSGFVRFEEFPLTANGKVDLKRLREAVHQKRRQTSG